jgi:hypothetical protein
MAVTARTDPYVVNQAVYRQLIKQVHTENALQKSILLTQSSSALFEASLIQALQSAWATYEEWRSRMDTSIQGIWKTLESSMASLSPDREWIAFAAREDHLIDPETPLRDPANIHYPSKEDPSVLPVHTGLLERKKRYTRTYREAYFVLTPAGFLHEYSSSDPKRSEAPSFSLFLPMCTLGPPSAPSAASHKFHIEGRKDGSGTTKTGSFRSLAGSITGRSGNGPAWTFRGRSHDDMLEWWNDIRMLCARYLVASESMDRTGPVQAAVRAVGYVSEEEADSEEEGSSIEEERDEDDDAMYAQARDMPAEGAETDEELPQYEHKQGVYSVSSVPCISNPRRFVKRALMKLSQRRLTRSRSEAQTAMALTMSAANLAYVSKRRLPKDGRRILFETTSQLLLIAMKKVMPLILKPDPPQLKAVSKRSCNNLHRVIEY